MNFLKKLFGSVEVTPEEEKKNQQAKDFDVLKYDGVAALKQNAPDYAIKCFTHALELRDDGETRDYLVQALIRTNNLTAAYKQLELLARLEPNNKRVWLCMADVAYMMEDYQAMTDACEKANEIDSEDVYVNYTYAKACIGREDFVNGIALLTKAVNLSEDNPLWEARLLRGQTLLKMGDAESAEHDADYMLEHIGEHEDVLMLKARCLEARDDNDNALIYYGKVIDTNPFCLDALRARAELRELMGDTQGAKEDNAVIEEMTARESPIGSASQVEENIQQKTEQAYKDVNPFG
jgi:tetratricopeptide (TPR) repeat protein